MLDFLQWYGAISSIMAALVVATNVSVRVTGWAFVVFVTSSMSLLMWGFMGENADGIGWQNVCLLIINLWGVYRYLLKPDRTQAIRGSESQISF